MRPPVEITSPIAIGQFGGELPLDAPEAPPRPCVRKTSAILPWRSSMTTIGVDELVPELLGEQPTDGGLAGAHEAGEHDVAGVRGSHGPTTQARGATPWSSARSTPDLPTMTRTVLVLNGPNLNLLGTREPEIYGHDTLADILRDLRAHAAESDVTIVDFQSNTEGELVGRLHDARGAVDGVIFNPGRSPTTASLCGTRSPVRDWRLSRRISPTSTPARSFVTRQCWHRCASASSPASVVTATSSRSRRCCDTSGDRSDRDRAIGALASVARLRARSKRVPDRRRRARRNRLRSGRRDRSSSRPPCPASGRSARSLLRRPCRASCRGRRGRGRGHREPSRLPDP